MCHCVGLLDTGIFHEFLACRIFYFKNMPDLRTLKPTINLKKLKKSKNINFKIKKKLSFFPGMARSTGASLNELPPRTTAVGPHFLATFLVVTLISNDRLSVDRHCPQSSSVWVHSSFLSLHQRIRPFSLNKTLSEPPLYRDRAILPPCAPAPPPRGRRVVCDGSDDTTLIGCAMAMGLQQ